MYSRRHALDHSLDGRLDRRRFLALSGTLAGLAAFGLVPGESTATPSLGAYPFTLGVASGDPLPHGVVLWTRLAPDPLHGGGMPDRVVPVGWRLAMDPGMHQVVRSGIALARPQLAHAVHVEVGGLRPGREYFYQFHVRDDESPVGRTRTAPDHVDELTPAVATCQKWDDGFYSAYRRMAEEDLDLVVHLGDYIYEYGIGATARRPRAHGRGMGGRREPTSSARPSTTWPPRPLWSRWPTSPRPASRHCTRPSA